MIDRDYSQFGLAPMEGVTDLATRLWFAKIFPPQFMCTPFWRVCYPQTNLIPNELFAPELDRFKQLVPYLLLPQVMSDNAQTFCRAAEALLDKTDFVDLNCGCPSPTVVGNGAGSSLLAGPEILGAFLYEVNKALGPKQLSIKMRTGYASEPLLYPDLIKLVSEFSLARLTVHGRTRLDRYRGKARWDLIEMAAKMSPFEVYGSGDIVDLTSFHQRYLEAPSIRGVIVGRGALRNPWIFAELAKETPVSIGFETLGLSLAVFGILQYLLRENPTRLMDMAVQGLFLTDCGNDLAAWQNFYGILCEKVFCAKVEYFDLELPSRVLSRIKMLWSYMRSSLPTPFFNPLPLRSRTFTEFLQTLRKLDEECAHLGLKNNGVYVLRYNSNLDWLYAGQAKPM